MLGPSASEQVTHLDVIKAFPPEWLPPNRVLAVHDVRRPSFSLSLSHLFQLQVFCLGFSLCGCFVWGCGEVEEFGEWADTIYCSVELDCCHEWGNRIGKSVENRFPYLSLDLGVKLSCAGSYTEYQPTSLLSISCPCLTSYYYFEYHPAGSLRVHILLYPEVWSRPLARGCARRHLGTTEPQNWKGFGQLSSPIPFVGQETKFPHKGCPRSHGKLVSVSEQV